MSHFSIKKLKQIKALCMDNHSQKTKVMKKRIYHNKSISNFKNIVSLSENNDDSQMSINIDMTDEIVYRNKVSLASKRTERKQQTIKHIYQNIYIQTIKSN